MTAKIDLYYSFRSPYSYLATPGANDLVRDFDVALSFRPVLPLALRNPDFFNAANLDKVRYIRLDWPRRAEMLGLPHGWPNPDPIVQDMETYKISADQPYIHDLSYLGIAAELRGRGLALATEVSRVIFGGTEGWNTGDHLAKAVDRAGLNLDELRAEIAADPDRFQAILEQNHEDQRNCGHSGVPTFTYDGAPYFGQDRIDTLCWQLERDGLKR